MYGTRRAARIFLSLTVTAAASASGCQSGAPRRVASAEPGLSGPIEPGASVIEAPPKTAPAVSFADRHPLFSKPRQYYDSSGNNRVVKTAAAAVIGVPAGIFGELKQIVVGAPSEPVR